jgi:hypothetical protein
VSKIQIIVALAAEAKPLIKFFRLQQDLRARPFAVYVNKSDTLRVIVSGVGRVAAAAALTFSQTYSQTNYQADSQNKYCINLGIAGSSHYDLGACYLVHKITVPSLVQAYYPCIQLIKKQLPDFLSSECVCVDQADNSYSYSLVDMESHGFFQAARLFVSQEQIYLLKVVSDRNSDEQTQINARLVYELIESAIPKLNQLIDCFHDDSYDKQDIPEINDLHFSAHQRFELEQLLRRLTCLGVSKEHITAGFSELLGQAGQPSYLAKQLIQWLKQTHVEKKLVF